jgi:hypothetical protein
VLRQWEASGLSQAQFCRQQEIPERKFWRWKKRLSGEGMGAGELFVPVEVATGTGSLSELELMLSAGRVLRFGVDIDVAKLAAIVAALEGLSC